jgi:hypothetical protein
MSFNELQIGMSTPSEHVGETVAGEAAACLKQIKSLVKGISTNTFDLFELLYKAKKNKYYQPKFESFAEYANSLDIKTSKLYYGVKIVEVCEQCEIPRAVYEPVGLAKLRIITRVKVVDEGKDTTFEDVPTKLLVKDMIEKANDWTPEALDLRVKEIQGLVGDNASAGWVNFPVTYAQKAAWEKAVALAMLQIGSVGKDENTGQFKDASLGSCAEVIAISYVLDPNNSPEDENLEKKVGLTIDGVWTPEEDFIPADGSPTLYHDPDLDSDTGQ